jgi:hypothetical protein
MLNLLALSGSTSEGILSCTILLFCIVNSDDKRLDSFLRVTAEKVKIAPQKTRESLERE